MTTQTTYPDSLNAIGVLKRREIEVRFVARLLKALGQEFDRERVFEIARALSRLAVPYCPFR